VPRADRILTFAAAPLYALMNLTLLIPLRLYALATLRRNGWGTRQAATTAVIPRQDAVTVPLAKLLDPITDRTLEMRLPGRGAA
jgi:hypothetical protein